MLWPLSGSLAVGFATAPETLSRVGRNYGLRGASLAWQIYLPCALPNVISGLELAWSYGWRAIVAAELVFGVTGSTAGLGWFINNARTYAQTDQALAGISMVVILGAAADIVFKVVQHNTTRRWGMER